MELSAVKFFVGGLPTKIKKKEIQQYFEQFGIIEKLSTYSKAKNKRLQGYCFVDFRQLNNPVLFDISKKWYLDGRLLQIEKVKKSSQLKETVSMKHKQRLYVADIPIDWDDYQLKKNFSKYGEILSAYIVRRKQESQKKWNTPQDQAILIREKSQLDFNYIDKEKYGFVIFKDPAVVQSLLLQGEATMNYHNTLLKLGIKPSLCNSSKKASTNSKIVMFSSEEHASMCISFHQGSMAHHFLKPTNSKFSQGPFAPKSQTPSPVDNFRFNRIPPKKQLIIPHLEKKRAVDPENIFLRQHTNKEISIIVPPQIDYLV